VHPLPDVAAKGLSASVMLEGKPFSQLLGESKACRKVVRLRFAQPVMLQAAATSSNAKTISKHLLFSRFHPSKVPAVVYWFSVVVKASTG